MFKSKLTDLLTYIGTSLYRTLMKHELKFKLSISIFQEKSENQTFLKKSQDGGS